MSAAVAHMQAGRQRRYVAPLIEYFGETPLTEITQKAIDDSAVELHPNVTPATRNRYVHSTVSVILHRALGDKCPVIRRPEGTKGKMRKDFMWPVDAFAVIDEAEKIDPELGLYLATLLYTGIRKSEGLGILPEDTQPDELAAWLRDSKNEDPRMLKLREDLAERLKARLIANPGRDRLFRFKEAGTSNTSCFDARWPSVACRALSGVMRAGRNQHSGWPLWPFTPMRRLPSPNGWPQLF